MKKLRLHKRKLKIWSQDYLVYRYLWPNLEQAIRKAVSAPNSGRRVVVDIGCGHKPYRDLFDDVLYLGMDCGGEDSTPDFLGDARQLPLQTGCVDIVFSTQVIEHVPHPQKMMMECGRVLKPGGYLILSGPFYWPLHEEPFDFYRFTKYGFAQMLKDAGFSSWEIKEDGGDWAQLMLALNLKLCKRWMAPLRCIVNIVGLTLNQAFLSTKSSANYTVLAKL